MDEHGAVGVIGVPIAMEANSDVQVVLFKNDGTSEVFELEEVLSHEGHAQLEIYEPEDQT
jgi:N6-adenosine-specific RNA methylase IME4